MVLGLSAYYHDSAAAFIDNENILFAAQEERYTRVKQDARFPREAIQAGLRQLKLRPTDLEAIVYYEKPFLTFERLIETYSCFAPRGFKSFIRALPDWLRVKLDLRSELKKELSHTFGLAQAELPPIYFSYHHLSHAASAFYPSGFSQAAVLCLDGVGEWATASAWLGDGHLIRPLWEMQFPHSVGLLYSSFTQFCGFKVNSGEYKLMGLAPYGNPVFRDFILNEMLCLKEDGSFILNLRYFDYPVGLKMVNSSWETPFDGRGREPESPLTQREADIARSIQEVLETILLKMASHLKSKTGQNNLCLAGGVALNCVANGFLRRSQLFDQIWIQPASGDAGGALGAALAWGYHFKGWPRRPHSHRLATVALGDEFDQESCERAIREKGYAPVLLSDEDLIESVSSLLSENKVVGWFQGPMEFGPRALGHRSILANPCVPTSQSRINQKIKFRESFRPLAPSMTLNELENYCLDAAESPFMIDHFIAKSGSKLKNSFRKFQPEELQNQNFQLPAVTHVDGSLRAQTVSSDHSPLYYQLLESFKKKQGVAALVNTSFNVRGEPIVRTPDEALRCFEETDMDALALGPFLIIKTEAHSLRRPPCTPNQSPLRPSQFGLD